MTEECVPPVPLRPQHVLDAWNSIVSSIPAFVYVALYSPDTGEVALISVEKGIDTTAANGLLFGCNHTRTVCVYSTKRRLIKIDNPVRKRMIRQSRCVESFVPAKQFILCAFSTPERALQCLSRWVETKGTQDLTE